MIYQKLLENAYEEISIFGDREGFYLDSNKSEHIQLQNLNLNKRLSHYIRWCDNNQRNLGFDLIITTIQAQPEVYIRRSYLEKSDDCYKITFYPVKKLMDSQFGKSLLLLENLQDSVLISEAEPIDEPGPSILYGNKAFIQTTGYSLDEVVGKKPRFLQKEDSSKKARENIRDAISKWKPIKQEIKNYKKSGEPFTVELNISPVADEIGWWTHWVSFQRNTTNQKLQQTLYQKLQESSQLGVWTLDVKTQESHWSPEVYRIYGVEDNKVFKKEEGINFYAPHDRAKIAKYVERCINLKEKYDDIFEFYSADGQHKWVRACGEPLIEPDGDVYQIFGTFQDVTNIYKEKRRFEELVDNAPDMIYRLDSSGVVTFMSKSVKQLMDVESNDIVGLGIEDIIYKDDIENFKKVFHDLLNKKILKTSIDYRVMTKNGMIRYHRSHLVSSYDYEGVQGIATDMTERKYIEDDLQDVLGESNIGIWRFDVLKNELFWDESMYRLYEVSKDDFSGAYEAWEKTLHPEDKLLAVEKFQQALANQSSFNFNFNFSVQTVSGRKYINAIGTVFRTSQGEAYFVKGLNRDITKDVLFEQEKQEQQKTALIQSRLASIGELAAGVGHEINNPLAIAMGNLENLKKNFNSSQLKEILNVESALNRIKNITDGLRVLSRNDQEDSVFDIKTASEESLLFVKDIYLKQNVSVNLETDCTQTPYVLGSRAEIQQVLMNLISNAKDATENQQQREIDILLSCEEDFVTVEIRDNGSGIAPSDQTKIFNSFYTTKDVRKGTGIGLAISNQIIKRHQGELSFKTTLGKGTTFFFKLPLVKNYQEMSVEVKDEEVEIFKTGLKILVVEDEEGLRELLEFMLIDLGAKVVLAQNGVEALEKLQHQETTFDLVISDIQMPKMNGIELLQTLRGNKDLDQPRFLFSTGGVNVDLDDKTNEIAKLCDGYITKPFSNENLIDKINEIFKE